MPATPRLTCWYVRGVKQPLGPEPMMRWRVRLTRASTTRRRWEKLRVYALSAVSMPRRHRFFVISEIQREQTIISSPRRRFPLRDEL